MFLLAGCNPGAHSHEHTDGTDTSAPQEAGHGEKGHAHGEDEILFSVAQAKAAGVMTEIVRKADFAETFQVSGQLLPTQGGTYTLSATISGIVKIADASLSEGKNVRNGQSLFLISTQELGDGNPVAAAKAELEAARREWERAQKLIADKIISEREYEAIRLRYETAQSTSASWGDGQDRRKVTAPINGYLQKLLVGNGDYVTAGQPMAVITQDRKIRLKAEVPERYYAALDHIADAHFRMSYAPDTVYEAKKMNGRLISAGRTTDPGEGFLPVVFEMDNTGQLIPGSMAEVFLLGRPRPQTISIPLSALTEELGLFYVYLQTSSHSYEKREVKRGNDNGVRVAITQGLRPGEKVVTRGAIALKLAANSGVLPDAHAGHNH